MRALYLASLLLISTFTIAHPEGHAPSFASRNGTTPGLMAGIRDSLTDVIMEFVEPPLLLSEQASASAAPTPYLQRFAEFQAAIGRNAMRSATALSGHEYHRIFFGTAVTLTGREDRSRRPFGQDPSGIDRKTRDDQQKDSCRWWRSSAAALRACQKEYFIPTRIRQRDRSGSGSRGVVLGAH